MTPDSAERRGPLAGVKVVDLATARAEMTGRLLADLGATVLKIEPPGGSEARRLPPFTESDEGPADDPEASLYWKSVALGKESAVLDLEVETDRNRLFDVLASADALVESFDPGETHRLGIDSARVAELNPGLVYASVTPYGQTGPKASWPASELSIEAAGGRVAMQGDNDRPPLPLGFPHSAFHAGAQAAADVVTALNEREESGLGQHLDTSMQECMIWTLMGPYGYALAEGRDPPGTGDDRAEPELTRLARLFPRLCRCVDGWVAVAMSPLGQSAAGGIVPQIMRELDAEGRLDEKLRAVDWDRWAEAFFTEELADDLVELAVERVEEELATRTKSELTAWTIEHKLRLGGILTTKDLLADPHHRERGFFREIDGTLHPGVPGRDLDTPPVLRRAPRLGEHQSRLDEWAAEVGTLRRAPAILGVDRSGEAFAGLKVADFSWVVAGPTMGKALADHGATVVRVESARRPDLARRLPPMKDGVEGINRGQWAAMFNTSKLSLALDLSLPEGRSAARRLADWADVVLESFSPGTMKRLGLDWETLSAGRDDLVMLSTSLFGPGGPLTPFVGYGQQAAAMVGLHSITGWPDRPPCGPFGPYTDVIAPKFGTASLAAALLERRRTGRGRHIDLSQAETGIRFLEPLVLDETVNGRTAPARGMSSPTACPHGVYATHERERYVALSVATSEEWMALRGLLGDDTDEGVAALRDESLIRLEARFEHREEIEATIARWCAPQGCRELERRLVDAGVPASVVQRATDLYRDPQLEHRGFREIFEHSELGPVLYDGFATRFSAKPTMLRGPTPCLGEHTRHVLEELLGMTESEIEELETAGVLE